MKVCPVCNETFPEELKFCDLDGARLHRDDVSVAHTQSKLWSLLGVGVVLGSLVIIALAVFFSPKTPAPANSFTPAPPNSSESKSVMADAASPYQPDVIEEESPVTEAKKKEKPLDSANSNTSISPASLKTTDPTSEDKAASSPIGNEAKDGLQPDPNSVEPVVNPKTVKVSTDTTEPSKTSTTEAKKEAKPSKDTEKASTDKKDDNKDKKKGGFLNVFKKIFGGKKDDKSKKKP